MGTEFRILRLGCSLRSEFKAVKVLNATYVSGAPPSQSPKP